MSDLIDRQAAIDALDRIFDQCEEIEAHLPKGDPDITGYKMYPDYMIVWEYLHQLPSAEPERKKGSWERHYSRPGVFADLFWHCSCCGYKNDYQYANVYHKFCPNCGEPMERGEKDAD